MTRLSELFNVNYFIVSQVNPHVAPFLYYDESKKGFFVSLFNLLKSELKHRINQFQELGLIPKYLDKWKPIVYQKYSGDITIVPRVRIKDFAQLFSNPSNSLMNEYMNKGQRITWPKLSAISIHCSIEFTLEKIIDSLKKEICIQNPKEKMFMNNGVSDPLPLMKLSETNLKQKIGF